MGRPGGSCPALGSYLGAAPAGFAEALLAFPVAATIKVVVIEVWLRDRVRRGGRLAKERMQDEVGTGAEWREPAAIVQRVAVGCSQGTH